MIQPGMVTICPPARWMPAQRSAPAATISAWFVGGMMLAVLAANGRARCYAFISLPLAVICYFIVSHSDRGRARRRPQRWPGAGRSYVRSWRGDHW